MAFVPFTKDEQPTMAAFNEKFEQAIGQAIGQAIADGVKIEVGSYVGTGTASADILVGFTPKVVLVTVRNSFMDDSGDRSAFILPGYPNEESVKRAEIIDGGFRVYYYGNSSIAYSSMLNYSGYVGKYIAIG